MSSSGSPIRRSARAASSERACTYYYLLNTMALPMLFGEPWLALAVFVGGLSAATGMDVDQTELKRKVNRSRNLHRALNNRRGMSRKDEKPPQDHWRHRFPELEEGQVEELSRFFESQGRNVVCSHRELS